MLAISEVRVEGTDVPQSCDTGQCYRRSIARKICWSAEVGENDTEEYGPEYESDEVYDCSHPSRQAPK